MSSLQSAIPLPQPYIPSLCLPTNPDTNPGHPSRQPRSIPIHSTSVIHSSIRTHLLGQAPHPRNQIIIIIDPRSQIQTYGNSIQLLRRSSPRATPTPATGTQHSRPFPPTSRRRDHSSLEHQLAAHLLAMLLLH